MSQNKISKETNGRYRYVRKNLKCLARLQREVPGALQERGNLFKKNCILLMDPNPGQNDAEPGGRIRSHTTRENRYEGKEHVRGKNNEGK